MFKDREHAARLLLEKLSKLEEKDILVYAIPRGAVFIGKLISQIPSFPFDVLIVRKIGAPGNEELAIGAIGPGESIYWDRTLCRNLRISSGQKQMLILKKQNELLAREKLFRKMQKYPDLQNKTVIVVDDGVATGATSIASAKFLRKKKAAKIILATPVIARDTISRLKQYYDDVIYLEAPDDFRSVAQFYEKFEQVTDEEVTRLLKDL